MNRGEAITAKLRASRRRHPRASRACETCRVRKTKVLYSYFATTRCQYTRTALSRITGLITS
ncbi:hypothetical protein BDV38DRAFT_256061 [Aspergillus pseudotamarii]|uniref:Uncharacterized protein n=1 Tax=Aspergillus pseudotamarii TaxID=132259 RepID=A0A5N6SKH0_ASPPS|nr:uncharacterized protein BDV38DRAFT_256061 [Aspergillus pseudotamarii]KAE8134250.1 hypothetical protein BDV38DRAFT_256061 [Aspergillus pseudotamarii]